MTQKNRPVQTTITSLSLLEKIKNLRGATVGELADNTDLARSTIHNHLQALLNTHYVVKSGNTYHVSMKLLNIGEYARTSKQEYKLAREKVQELANKTDMEVDFTVEEQKQIIILFDTMGSTMGSGLDVGRYFHIHSTSAGKAILAELPEEYRERILDDINLVPVTENTITDMETLRSKLADIRQRGYAINSEECIEGYRTIGAAVHYPDGSVVGALSVGGPSYLQDDDIETLLREELQTAVANLEEQIETSLFDF